MLIIVTTSKSILLLMIFTIVIVPMMDQLACDFCGPTPENSMTAQPVHSDECVMKDDFKRPGPLSENGEATHIHFCVLHSTSIVLESYYPLVPNLEKSDYEINLNFRNQTLASLIYHPPICS